MKMMARTPARKTELQVLLTKDHSLNGAILSGLDGRLVEIQARATKVLPRSASWSAAVNLTVMATGAVREVLGRIAGDIAKLQIAEPEVEILINLALADLPKHGT